MTSLSESLEGKVYLSDLNKDDKVWDEHGKARDKVRAMYESLGYDRYAERMSECSTKLEFLVKRDVTGKNHFKLHAARFCRVRFCPICQWRKELMWRARFFKNVERIIKDYPTHRYVFGTFTVKNCPVDSLRVTVKDMTTAWNRLTKRKDFPAVGYVRTLEVTRGQDGSAHPHFHVLMMVKPSYFTHGYVKHDQWTELWRESMRLDYTPIVNIKAVKNLKKKGTEKLSTGMERGICETLKYSVKTADLVHSPHWLGQLTDQMHKLRTVSLGGIFKQYLSEDDPENLINGDIEDDSDIQFSDEALILFTEWNNYTKRFEATSWREAPKPEKTCNE